MQNTSGFAVATYNIQFGVNREKLIGNMVQMAKDGVGIFCLQEIINMPDEEFIIVSILEALGKDWEAKYHVGIEISKLSIGTAILWNTKQFTFKKQEKILLPKLNKFDLHENFYYKVVGVPGVVLQRKALSCYFEFEKTTIRVTSVHVDNVGGPLHRMKQVSFLMSKLRLLETPQHEIICGDFNTFDLLKTGYEKKILQKELGEDFIDASEKIDWTSDIYMIDFRTSVKFFPWAIKTFNIHIQRRLDYVWIKNLHVLSCYKLSIQGSDHYPIVAKLELPVNKVIETI